MRPLVSIIIPVYNGSNYLKQAIDSALAQTYNNVEVIVINDGSNDNGATEAIAKSYGNKIRYYTKPNGGVSTALNLGIKKMKGQYFSWLSHDDLYHPQKIEKQMEVMEKRKDKMVMIYSDFSVLNESTGKTEYVILDHQMLVEKPKYSLLRGCVNGLTVLIPKKIIDRVGNFNEKLRYTQDYDYWMRIQTKFPSIHLKSVLTTTRLHPKQDGQKAQAQVEADQLWIKMIQWLPIADQEAYEGTEWQFWMEMLNYLENTKYELTKKRCLRRLSDLTQKISATMSEKEQEVIRAMLKQIIEKHQKNHHLQDDNNALYQRILSVDAENQRLMSELAEIRKRPLNRIIRKIIKRNEKYKHGKI